MEGILSPFLFNILMENIANIPLPPLTEIFIFADDVAIVTRGHNRNRNIQQAIQTINNKSIELGLKINTNKTKAMSIKSAKPEYKLTIGTQEIEWVETYKYLGVYLDIQLNFNKQVTYLRERAKSRLAPMRYMISTKEGAKAEIQKLYYTAATRSLINYSAPVLVNLKDTQYTKLEVLQNNALRLMLGAPMWTRLCNLQYEGNLPTLKLRIELRNIHIVAKTLIADRNSITKNKMIEEINRHPQARRQNTYSTYIGNIIRDKNLINTFKQIKTDAFEQEYNPPPWENTGVVFNYTILPTNKHLCSKETLMIAANTAIQKVETQNSYIIYTDGSVDPTTETAGSAVYSKNFQANWRVTNKASTMQTD